ncbi:MAG: M1 family metallopeptidase [Planctomycetota bacterium]
MHRALSTPHNCPQTRRGARSATGALRLGALALLGLGVAHGSRSDTRRDVFRQLDELLPTPNDQRAASGAPGSQYWQQQVDYVIDVSLDDATQRLTGSERITYHNESPDELRYLWVSLDPNIYSPSSHARQTEGAPDLLGQSYEALRKRFEALGFDGSCQVLAVRDALGAPLHHTIVDTMMRVDLPAPLRSGQKVELSIDWTYAINESRLVSGRTGFERFPEDGNQLYELAQWFPRLCAYTDYQGWQNKQFLGRGEFTLEFGDYLVRITVPEDHVVAATGTLQNPTDVLKPAWRERLAAAQTAERPVLIITREEAEANEASRATGTKTWVFAAQNVRDFAWASSRKFLWDAVLHPVKDGHPVWAMSYWPKEGEPLWSRYSTHSIVHTLDVYSEHCFPYPYPVAISVNGPVGGMEYPMLCFNGPRPEKDGTYSKSTKYGLISVIIHEVGHNWFPMIVNSDERQWTWMDEGLNTFVQYLAEQTWEPRYPSRRGEPNDIVGYMASAEQVPIMTNSESILQFGNNAYGKPATALNILRETVMGRELFDFAFREYSRRWMFKRPQPADLFRTLEDASAVDLDWFWRGWFYTTEHVDLAVSGVRLFTLDSGDPEVEKERRRAERDARPVTLSQERFSGAPKRSDRFPELLDFYNRFDELDITTTDVKAFDELRERLSDEDEALLTQDLHFYVIDVENEGGLVAPLAFDVTWEDGTVEHVRVPAEIWRSNSERVSKLVIGKQPLTKVVLDPRLESADTDLADNTWPRAIPETRVRLRESRGDEGPQNPMQAARDEAERLKQRVPTPAGDQ